ncbi:MAG: hypothetical protein U0R78_19660 [Nocardioidaceae bacterium]
MAPAYTQRRMTLACDKCGATLARATLWLDGPAEGELNLVLTDRYTQTEEEVDGMLSNVRRHRSAIILHDQQRGIWYLRCGACRRSDIRVAGDRLRTLLEGDTPSRLAV